MERKAKCNNVGVCSLVGKIQVITDDEAELICPECGEELEPVVEEPVAVGPKKWKKIAVACAGVVVAAGVGFGVWKVAGQSNSGKEPAVEPVDTAQVDTVKVDTVQKTEPQKDIVVDTKEQTETETTPKKSKEEDKKNGKTDPKRRTPWASYASFDGTTMTFKKSHVIPGTSRMARPGDKVTGMWRDGEVNSVRWYHADGSPSEVLIHD